MSHTLTAKEQSLSRIFCADYVFHIPGYQRPYSWGTEQARELIDDLIAALSLAPESLGDSTPYFLGSIVLIKPESSTEATVVDGQQRLTTLTLLLSAIRATVADDVVQNEITSCIYEKGSVVKATQPSYRLSLRDRDREFFRTYVQHEDGLIRLVSLNDQLPDAQDRLRSNAKVFMTELSKLSQSDLVRLVQFIITRCYLVTVATPDLDSAYRIFGVLNSRGLDLSATDILKADIIGQIEESLRDDYTRKWESKEEDLGRSEFGDLFSHIRMVYRKSKPHGTLLKEFKEHVLTAHSPRPLVDEVIIPMAEAFSELRDAVYTSTQHAEKVNEHLTWLNRLEFNDWVPPALRFFVLHRNDPGLVLDFFRDLERLSYSMLIRKIGPNGRIERFSALTTAIESQMDLFDVSSPLQLSAEEQHLTYTALDGAMYDTHSSRALALLLLRLDRLMSDATATYLHNVVSVEHVMPQQPAPNSTWAVWMPDKADHQRWVHRLGNLALLSRKKNSSASNRDFGWKKSSYFTKGGTSAFALTTEVLQHADWTLEVLEKRQARMVGLLESHWRLQGRRSKEELGKELLRLLEGDGSSIVFEISGSRSGITAQAKQRPDSFTVLKGSQARLNWTGKSHAYEQLRLELQTGGTLSPSADGTHLVFMTDVDFSSPSAASAVVVGRADNGRTTWRIKGSTITYGAWKDNQPANQAAEEVS